MPCGPKIDQAEADGEVNDLIDIFTYAGLCVAALAVPVYDASHAPSRVRCMPCATRLAWWRRVCCPKLRSNAAATSLARWVRKVDELVQALREQRRLCANASVKANTTPPSQPASDNDILGMSLINMRNNLIENERRDKERNWIVRGVAEISEILRMHDSIDELGDDVIKFILDKIGAMQGAFYVVNDDDQRPVRSKCAPAMPITRKKYLESKIQVCGRPCRPGCC